MAVAVQVTSDDAEIKHLLRKEGREEHVAFGRTLHSSSHRHGDDQYHKNLGPYGDEHAPAPSPPPPPPPVDDTPLEFDANETSGTQQAANRSSIKQEEAVSDAPTDKSSIFLYKDDHCKERTIGKDIIGKAIILPGVILPPNSEWDDGSCLKVSSPSDQPQLVQNLRISCSSDGGAQVEMIYGEECAGGVDDKYKLDISEEAAEGLFNKECVKALNRDSFQVYYARLTLQDDDNISLPGCIYTWKNFFKKNWKKALFGTFACFAFAVGVYMLIKAMKKCFKKKKKETPEEVEKLEEDVAKGSRTPSKGSRTPSKGSRTPSKGSRTPSERSVKSGDSDAGRRDDGKKSGSDVDF